MAAWFHTRFNNVSVYIANSFLLLAQPVCPILQKVACVCIVNGPDVWNSLPVDLRSPDISEDLLRKKLRRCTAISPTD